MNYKKYYEDQAGSNFPVFHGYAHQRGHGLGGIFRTFYKFIMPIFKTHALPFLKKGAEIVGTEAVKTAANIANDAISGKNVREAAREHLSSAVNTLSTKAQSGVQLGSGGKRKKKIGIIKKKAKKSRRIRDIFDHQ